MSQRVVLVLPESDKHLIEELRERLKDHAELVEIPEDPLYRTRTFSPDLIYAINFIIGVFGIINGGTQTVKTIKEWCAKENLTDKARFAVQNADGSLGPSHPVSEMDGLTLDGNTASHDTKTDVK